MIGSRVQSVSTCHHVLLCQRGIMYLKPPFLSSFTPSIESTSIKSQVDRKLTYYIYEYHLPLNIYFITEPEERCGESHTFILLCINYSILPFLSIMFSRSGKSCHCWLRTRPLFALIGGYRATGMFQQGTAATRL